MAVPVPFEAAVGQRVRSVFQAGTVLVFQLEGMILGAHIPGTTGCVEAFCLSEEAFTNTVIAKQRRRVHRMFHMLLRKRRFRGITSATPNVVFNFGRFGVIFDVLTGEARVVIAKKQGPATWDLREDEIVTAQEQMTICFELYARHTKG